MKHEDPMLIQGPRKSPGVGAGTLRLEHSPLLPRTWPWVSAPAWWLTTVEALIRVKINLEENLSMAVETWNPATLWQTQGETGAFWPPDSETSEVRVHRGSLLRV